MLENQKTNADNTKSLGERLKLISKRVGGGNELARSINVSRRTLESWFTNSTEPKAGQIIDIATETRVSSNWLLTGEGKMETRSLSDIDDKMDDDPFIQDAAMVELMSSQRITPQMVKDAVNNMMLYLEKEGREFDPDAMSTAISLLCEIGASEGKVTMQTVEKLMKIRDLG